MESVVADSETLCMDGDIDLNDLDYTMFDSAASAFLEQNLVEFEGEEEEEDIVQQNQRDKDNYDLEATIRGVFYDDDDDDDDEETEIPTPFTYQSSYENYEPTFANFNQHTQSPLSHQVDQRLDGLREEPNDVMDRDYILLLQFVVKDFAVGVLHEVCDHGN